MLLPITLAALPAIVSPMPVAAPAPARAGAPASVTAPLTGPLAGPLATPIQRVRARRADDTAQLVRLITRDRISLAAEYYKPRARSGRSPGAIVVHDAGADRTQASALAESLYKKGFGVLVLDLRGHGQSATDELNWSRLDDRARETTWAFATRDLDAAAEYLREQREIHSANLSLVGIGAGCALVVRHAVDNENARAVVLINPPRKSLGFDMARGVCDLQGLPCLILAPKEGRDAADSIQACGHEANDGYQYVEVQVARSGADEILTDKRVQSSSVSWLRDKVLDDKRK